MMLRSLLTAVALLSALAVDSAARAADYWTYTYQGMDVTTDGSAAYAVGLAHKMRRLDAAIVKILGTNFGEWRPPTHIYAVSSRELTRLTGAKIQGSSVFTTDGFENYIVVDTTGAEDNQFWGAYFGYAGALLMSEADLRYPPWFVHGISEVFAASSMKLNKVSVGNVERGYSYTLARTALIPMRAFLSLRPDDPQIKSGGMHDVYEAECWFLVHAILVDRQYRPEFNKYLSLLSAGQSEDAAFAASFNISYEDLDHALRAFMQHGVFMHWVLDLPDVPDPAQPRRISAAEMNGRLAVYAVSHSPDRDYGTKLAEQSLAAEPGDEYALRALMTARLNEHDYPEALKFADKLGAGGSLSAAAHADRAQALLSMGMQGARNTETPGVDSPALYQRARADYQHAIELDGGNPAYWSGLAEVIGRQRDAAAANEVKPKLMEIYYQHPRVGHLARAIASMCSTTGDGENAFKFTVAWQNNAMTDAEHDEATAYLSHLKAYMERHEATDAAQGRH